MEAITYLNALDTVKKDGQKLAKISQDKMTNLRNKYHDAIKKLQAPVEEKKVEATPVASVPSQPLPVVTTAIEDNYEQVVDNFSLTVYGDISNEKPLTGARKIRVNPKVTKHVKGLSQKFGNVSFVDDVVVKEEPKEEIQEEDVTFETEIPVAAAPVITEPVVSEPVAPAVEESATNEEEIAKDIGLPSVDDYLQKDRPNADTGVIGQLNDDVANLKAETIRRAALLENLESKYQELQEQKARRIKELEEERLSYTATLEGLTQRIIDLQTAIAKEEQSLSTSKKVA